MPRPVVYLSGSMDGRPYDECWAERNRVKQALEAHGIAVLDPLRGKAELRGTVISRDDAHTKWGGIRGIVARDKRDLQRSDLVLILTGDTPSDGTWLEYGYALYKLEIPVVMVAPSRVGKHGWSNQEATYIARDIDDAIRWIVQYFFYEEPEAPLTTCDFCGKAISLSGAVDFGEKCLCESCAAAIPNRVWDSMCCE